MIRVRNDEDVGIVTDVAADALYLRERVLAAYVNYIGQPAFNAWARATIRVPDRLGEILGQDDTPENRRLLTKILANLSQP